MTLSSRIRASGLDAWMLFPGDVADLWHGSRHSAIVLADLEAAGWSGVVHQGNEAQAS